jgi:hypothetical protein
MLATRKYYFHERRSEQKGKAKTRAYVMITFAYPFFVEGAKIL